MADMQPGPELDRLVADAVGWECIRVGDRVFAVVEEPDGITDGWNVSSGAIREPSTNIADAIAALEAVREQIGGGCLYKIVRWSSGTWSVHSNSGGVFGGEGDTLPLAICRAILAWREAQNND